MIFVDTGAWYASAVPNDADHPAAAAFLSSNRERLATSEYIVDEVVTLLRARGENERAIDLGQELLHGQSCKLMGTSERCPTRLGSLQAVWRQGMEFHGLHQSCRNGAAANPPSFRLRSALPAVWHGLSAAVAVGVRQDGSQFASRVAYVRSCPVDGTLTV